MPIAETFNDSFDTDNNQESIQQMDAATFFPLMLQAQDLVTKLESRVVELENDLETINEAHEQERDQLLQEIGEKDEYIHNLKKKVSRLEFGAREAIIVLARTVETLKTQNDNDDDDEKEDDDNATAVESTDLEGQFLDSIKLCLNYLKNAQNYQKASKNRKKRSIPIRRDSKLQQSNDEDYDNDEEVVHHKHETNTKPIDDNDNDTSRSETIENVNDYDNDSNDDNNNNNDIDNDNDNIDSNKNDEIDTRIQQQQQQQQQLLSSPNVSPSTRRVSISNSQISLEDIPDLDDYDLDGDEDIAAFNISEDEGPNNFASKFRLTPRKSIDSSHDEEERRHLEAAYAMNNNNRNTNYVREPEEIDDHDDDDIGNSSDSEDEEEDDRENVDIRSQLPPQGPIPNISHTDNSCPNCSVLLAQVDQHLEERAYLKRDLSALAISLSEEQGLRAQIQAGKESLEQEIDDWLNAMFEKVNQMVFDEANTREEIELLSREYKGKLEHLLKGSNARQDRLRELKLLLVHLDSAKQRQAGTIMHNGSSALNRNSVARRSIMSSSPANSPRTSRIFGNLGHMSPSIFSSSSTEEYGLTKGKRVYIDGVLFEEFQEYIKSFITSPAPSTSNPTHSFMKRCMAEDIQPCLFEGSTGWKSPFYKRRLLDAIMKNQCEIQTIYYSSSNSMPSTPISSQISNNSASRSNSYHEPPPAPKVKCGLCGHLRSCDFRMRLSGPDAAIPPSTTTITSSTQSSRFSINSNPGWIPLDRFCRDRVVAVCDFYSYLSHLRQGLLNNSPVWGMYKQCLKYRRKMGMARVGSVSMFEEEENISNEILNNSEMEAMVVLVH